jgi:hypothetical protein
MEVLAATTTSTVEVCSTVHSSRGYNNQDDNINLPLLLICNLETRKKQPGNFRVYVQRYQKYRVLFEPCTAAQLTDRDNRVLKSPVH